MKEAEVLEKEYWAHL